MSSLRVSLRVVNLLNGSSFLFNELGLLIDHIRRLSVDNKILFRHVSRSGNRAAHVLILLCQINVKKIWDSIVTKVDLFLDF